MTREELLEHLALLKEQARNYGANTFIWDITQESFNFVIDSAIKALEQEPRKDEVILTNKEYRELISNEYDHGYCKGYTEALQEQEPILDKIRAEIETKYGQCKLTEYIVQYDGICTSANDIGDIADILQIIDKYKAETEET